MNVLTAQVAKFWGFNLDKSSLCPARTIKLEGFVKIKDVTHLLRTTLSNFVIQPFLLFSFCPLTQFDCRWLSNCVFVAGAIHPLNYSPSRKSNHHAKE